jgi:hypothetical protein
MPPALGSAAFSFVASSILRAFEYTFQSASSVFAGRT